MARQLVGIGSSANDGTGDTLRDGIDKVNDNFIEIYGKIGDGTTIGTFTTTDITSTGDFTINSSAKIHLDMDGSDPYIGIKDSGALVAYIQNDVTNNRINFACEISNRDIIIKGSDGGNAINALSLDMSEAGAATFNSTVTTTGIVATKTASSSDVASSSGAVTSNVNSISHTLTLGGTLADDARHADVTVTSSKVLATSTIVGAVSINADVHVHTIAAGSFKFAFTNRSGGTLADNSTAIFNFVIL